jgi:glucarate dehydratase
MAMAHLGCAVPELVHAIDTHYPWQCEEVIKGGRIQFEDGTLRVSDEPGLGLELDYEKLEELRLNYINCGLTERNDEIEMQKVKPGWKFSEHIF